MKKQNFFTPLIVGAPKWGLDPQFKSHFIVRNVMRPVIIIVADEYHFHCAKPVVAILVDY